MKKKIAGGLVLIAVLLFFLVTACSSPVATPTPTATPPDPVQQRQNLLDTLVGPEKEGYTISNFLFELQGKAAYDKLTAIAESFGKIVVVYLMDKEDKVLATVPLWGFVQRDQITFPYPHSFIKNLASLDPQTYAGFQAMIYPEQLLLNFEESNFATNENYGLYTVRLPQGLQLGLTLKQQVILPRGNIALLKPMDFVYIAGADGFIPGQVVSQQKEGAEFFLITPYVADANLGGGLVVAFERKSGLPYVMGMVVSPYSENVYVVLDINILLKEKLAPSP